MPTFEILCTTMNQQDFSKLKEMNVHCDILYANQASTTAYDELKFDGGTARMITTETRGVGNNRNIGLIYAKADICILADDDMVYEENVEQIVLGEFEKFPNADAIIFNVISDNPERKQVFNKKCKRMTKFSRNPYGAFRIAFKLKKIKHHNIWFTTLFGGGSPFPSGEDSLFIKDMLKSGMKIYLSDKVIGRVKQEDSTWYKGMNDKNFFRNKGTFIQASRKGISKYLYVFYYALRTGRHSNVRFFDKVMAMLKGMDDYKKYIKE